MKRFLATAFALAIFSYSVSALAENPSSFSFGCAPWDGSTLDMNVGAPDAVYNIQIWGRGLTGLRQGEHTIIIDQSDGSGSSDTTGRAYVQATASPGAKPAGTTLTVHFDTLNLGEGGSVAGYLELSGGMKIPFQGVISGHQLCG